MKNTLAFLLLSAATIGSVLGQAPASIGGYTLRIAGGYNIRFLGNPYRSIDLFSNGTYVTRVEANIEPVGTAYVYTPPQNGTYTYRQTSATQGIITLSPAAQQLVLTFSSHYAGTTPGQAFVQSFSIVPTGGVSPARALVNMSVLISAQIGTPVSFGFVIGGTDPCREILIRAIGPSLAQFGVMGFAPLPTYLLSGAALNFDITGSFTGNIWSANAALSTTVTGEDTRAGAFPLLQGSNDEADVYILTPGAYTITVNPTDPTQVGAELIEVYEVE